MQNMEQLHTALCSNNAEIQDVVMKFVDLLIELNSMMQNSICVDVFRKEASLFPGWTSYVKTTNLSDPPGKSRDAY